MEEHMAMHFFWCCWNDVIISIGMSMWWFWSWGKFDDDLTSRNTGMMLSGNYHQMALCQVVELSWFIQIWSRLITIDLGGFRTVSSILWFHSYLTWLGSI